MVNLFWFFQQENFENERNVLKGRSKIPNRIIQTEIVLTISLFKYAFIRKV